MSRKLVIQEECGDEMADKFQCLVLHKRETPKRGMSRIFPQLFLPRFCLLFFWFSLEGIIEDYFKETNKNLYNFLHFLSGKIYRIYVCRQQEN